MGEGKILRTGKLPSDLLERMLKQYPGVKDDRLIVGPKIGEDTAIIEPSNDYIAVKSDPITFATDQIGWYAVNVNANDLATRGARPKWFQPTILFPEKKTTVELVEEVFSQISRACIDLGAAIVGGHTEVTIGLNRTIISGTMIGEVARGKMVTTSGARPGDDIILTKGIVIEGTSIIARERESDLREKGYSEDFIKRCKNYLFDPGISVVRDGLLANETVDVHSMHDPTEGGLANGLYEIARAADVGMLIYRGKIPVLKESEILCNNYGLDPLGTITSGTLVVTLDSEDSQKLLNAYQSSGIKATIIGKVREKSYGIKIFANGKVSDLAYSEKDEITKIFE